MLCELDKTEDKICILQAPLINTTYNWTCLYISYELSSDDVKMTLDLLAGNESVKSYNLSANEKEILIPNPDRNSISFQLRASRYLVSAEDYESAVVKTVEFRPCIDDTGEFLCLNQTLNTCK